MDGINFRTDFNNIVVAFLSGITILGFPMILKDSAAEGKIRLNIIQGQYYSMAK
jgi:hypothetical protein